MCERVSIAWAMRTGWRRIGSVTPTPTGACLLGRRGTQEYLVVEELVGRGALAGDPGELLVPDG